MKTSGIFLMEKEYYNVQDFMNDNILNTNQYLNWKYKSQNQSCNLLFVLESASFLLVHWYNSKH
jgi:hypothetical protein